MEVSVGVSYFILWRFHGGCLEYLDARATPKSAVEAHATGPPTICLAFEKIRPRILRKRTIHEPRQSSEDAEMNTCRPWPGARKRYISRGFASNGPVLAHSY